MANFYHSINDKDTTGRTPLHHACSVFDDQETLEDMDIDNNDYDEYEPVYNVPNPCSKLGDDFEAHIETIEVLLSRMEEFGLDPNIRDAFGNTPIQSFCCPSYPWNLRESIIQVFEKYGLSRD